MKRIATSIFLVTCAVPLLVNCGESFLGGGLRGTGGTGGHETSGHGHGVAVTSGTGTSGPATVGAGGAIGGQCGIGGGAILDDGNPCTQEICKDGMQVHAPVADGTPCNVDPCLLGQACHAGVCAGGSLLVCKAGTSCVAGACVAPCTGPLGYAPSVEYDVHGRAFGFAVADLNGDGKPDLAAPVIGGTTDALMVVLMSNGDGTFAPRVEYSLGPVSTGVSIASGDLNGDGKPDIVVAREGSGDVAVFLNKGDGTFAPRVDYATSPFPTSVAVADLNGDGKPDIVTANGSLLFNKGDGTFAPKVDLTTAGYMVVAADMNGDGSTDLGFVSPSGSGEGTLSVLLNDGHGTFAAKVDYDVGPIHLEAVTADLNGDGKPDVVVPNENTVSVLLNNGDGTFAPKVQYAVDALIDVVAADLNGDGKPDLAVTTDTFSNGSWVVGVLLNNGDGTFAPEVTFSGGFGPASIAALNLTGDGRPDLVLANNNANSVSVMLNTCHP